MRSSGRVPGFVAADADGACLVYSDRRVDWRSAPWDLSRHACPGQMHRKVDPDCCGAGSVAADGTFADTDAGAIAAAAAAADGKAVAGDAAGTAFGIVRKARRAGRPAACIPCHASYADVHHREKQCSVHT